MKVLFIGGTGTISMAISKLLLSQGHTLYLLNRGGRNSGLIGDLVELKADINDEDSVHSLIDGLEFDVAVDFIAFVPAQLERDYRLFKNKTKQFVYISSASAYQKPLSDYRITEGTPLANPYWEYSRNKIAGEDYLMKMYRETGFPVTIVRPSHTYDERSVPLGVHGDNGSYSVVKRIREGKPVIIHGDGTSLWTWNQLYQIIADALGVKLNAIHVSSEFLDACSNYDFAGSLLGDKANTVVFDNAKLKRLVPGFTATVRADQGIRDSVKYVLSHPECQREDPAFDEWCDKVAAAMKNAAAAVKETM